MADKVKTFSHEEQKKYIYYVTDSYTHVRQFVPGNMVGEIMEAFYKINTLLKKANERYKK